MKIIRISFDDIIVDPRAAAGVLETACSRKNGWQVKSVCCLSDEVAFLMLPSLREKTSFVFAKFASENDDDVLAEISKRYYAGLDLVGTFFIDESLWGLYEKNDAKS
jgi:hypothetical protein